ncbi:zinc transporter ZntB [Planktotalea sp.]|uniref:zinc transporter ZntB n=1 Tax=Planktotalea sp. TaxID=2029877 RepID=UPI0025DBFAA5|nr:zinc transporter ZntB [Planktotalea sp.]
MSTPNPIAAFDIGTDGTTHAIDLAENAPTRGWSWAHFDLADPNLADWLATQVDPLVAKALLAAETRPRVDAFEGGLIVTLRGVNLNPDANPENMVSLRLWVTSTRIISVRKRRLMALDALRVDAEKGTAPATPAAFLTALVDGLCHRIETVSLEFEEHVDALEESSLNADQSTSKECLALRQSIIKLSRFVGPQREAVERLATDVTGTLQATHSNHLREAANRTARTVEALDASRDRLMAIQEHVDAHGAMTLGRNSYVLSVMAAIFLPLGFLTGLFGVNVAGMPGTEWIWAFAALTALSTAIGIALYAVFRWRGWL